MCPPLAPAFASQTYQRCLLRDDKSIRPHKQPFTRRRSYIQRASSILSLLCSSEQLIANKIPSSFPPPSHPFPSPPLHHPSAAQREPAKKRFDLHKVFLVKRGKERRETQLPSQCSAALGRGIPHCRDRGWSKDARRNAPRPAARTACGRRLVNAGGHRH